MTAQQKTLQARLDQNYQDYVTGLQGKTIDELIKLAPEITAAQQLRETLTGACDKDDIAFLLHFDNPLDLVRGYWEGKIIGCDHRGEMGHTLWKIREDIEQQDKTPIAADEIAVDPVMDFTGKEIVAYVEIGFDVGRRFQVYPDIDDICGLYVRYDLVSKSLRGKLCIKGYGYDAEERWEPVELLPTEQKLIIDMMGQACWEAEGKTLLEVWVEQHPAFNFKSLHKKKHGRKQHER